MSHSPLLPPLPDFLPPYDESGIEDHDFAAPADGPTLRPPVPILLRSIRCGCWLIEFQPVSTSKVRYDGTLRVECHSAGRTASGDLYQRPVLGPFPVPGPGPNPAHGIPRFARSRYRFYVRVTSLPERRFIGNKFQLGIELWRFTAPNAWAKDSDLTAFMTRTVAPAGYPSPSDYAAGDVKDATGRLVARLTMGWLSEYFRRATLEIDTVAGSEQPLASGAGHDWSTVMNAVGWQLDLICSDTNVVEPSGNSWSDGEMHAAMLARRQAVNLDRSWHYHILAVRNIDSTPRGIMYDNGGTDSNNVPREGVGIASHWMIPATGWGTVGGMRFGTAAAPYFRTAVHELGHALGLFHNTADHGFMCTSDVIAAAGTPANPFPSNIQWAFHPDNLKQLRHYPDPFVRPGGVVFGGASPTTPPITPTDLEFDVPFLSLSVGALLPQVPQGAPVRIDYTLTNSGTQPITVPADLTLKGHAIEGTVTDPAGTVRTFRPLVRCVEDEATVDLLPGATMSESITLMRGAEGALFGTPGVHEVRVTVHWEVEGLVAAVSGDCSVMVTAAVDDEHAKAAHKVLTTPDAHLVLALGGDHLQEGIAAIQAALDSAVLRPHFAVIEAKRVGRRFGNRKASPKEAAELIESDTVMSGAEAGKLAKIIAGAPAAATKDAAKRLKSRAKMLNLSQAAKKALDSL